MTTVRQSKLFPDTADVNSLDHLMLGGCDTMSLLEQFGSPLYVYDVVTLRNTAEAFRNSFTKLYPKTQIIYASKAFINIGMAKLLSNYGLGFDVVSGGEMAILKIAGITPAEVFFHGNNKTPEELREAVTWGIGRIVIDGFQELQTLNSIAANEGVHQPVLIRVSPEVDPHTHSHTTTGILDSKFGFPISTGQAKEAVLQTLAASNLDLLGLHFHLGSPIFELEPYRAAIHLVMEFAAELQHDGLELKEFSPGGGFAIAYTESDQPPLLTAYAGAITGALKMACKDLGITEPSLIVEPGRAMIGRAGVALYTVGTIKEVPGVRTYVAVDGGMGDNIRPALYGARYEAIVANHATKPATEIATIAGKYCESGDVLVWDARIAPVRPGDVIAVPVSGAYTPSMASNYNLNGRPAMVLVENGTSQLLRRRESYEDMIAQDVI